MDIMPSKTTLTEFRDYLEKLPSKYEASIDKSVNDYILSINIGKTTHLVRCDKLEPLMSFCEGVVYSEVSNDVTRKD